MSVKSEISDPVAEKPQLIETMLWQSGSSYWLLSYHLDRLARSAAMLGFNYDENNLQNQLIEFADKLAAATDNRQKQKFMVRLLLTANGDITISNKPLTHNLNKGWVVSIASDLLAPNDLWLQHKTTNRQLYDNARQNIKSGIDEIIFLNTRSELCEGTITNLFVIKKDSEMLTPPTTCGLLPGTLRQYLLNQGEAKEEILTTRDIYPPNRLLVGNSLRGLVTVKTVINQDEVINYSYRNDSQSDDSQGDDSHQ